MNKLFKRCAVVAMILAVGAWAGALTLQIGDPNDSQEAMGLHAALTAQVTACKDPAKSTVSANYIQVTEKGLQRTALQVVPMKALGKFAVVGAVPNGSVVEVTVTNSDYANYQPRVLLRTDARGIQWTSVKHFYSTPPTDTDVKAVLEAAID
jgi:hypothetical protein